MVLVVTREMAVLEKERVGVPTKARSNILVITHAGLDDVYTICQFKNHYLTRGHT
jgi:hypothetical protein